MRTSVLGLGYVGSVTAACLARQGHDVVGVDIDRTKVDLINDGAPPVLESGLGDLISDAVADGRLRATTCELTAVRETDVSMICVGTPCRADGDVDLTHLLHCCEGLGSALRHKPEFHVVICRSTVLPGTTRQKVIPTLERASGKVCGRDFGVCFNPEFLRESTAVDDFYNPAKTVIGVPDTGDVVVSEVVERLYHGIGAPLFRTTLETAEVLKYVENSWHALKVGFANEVGAICKRIKVDSHEVMELFRLDSRLNLSGSYLTPGFAFGGSCLPKDLRALNRMSQVMGVDLPILSSVLPSNRLQVARAADLIMARQRRRVGILGISFKAGTDDLRESPMISLIELLIGKGYDLAIYDPNVRLSRLIGANRDFVLQRIPHIARLLTEDMDGLLRDSELIVIGNTEDEFRPVPDRLRNGQMLVDLVRLGDPWNFNGQYEGIGW